MIQDDYNAINSLVQDFNKYSKYNANNPKITLYNWVLVKISRDLKTNIYNLILL